MTLIFDLLTLVSDYVADHMVNLSTKFEDPAPIHS